ncbi:hypothetical protein IG631_05156 [Alternaria alternata]|nr:hypothetical protein IG631_05156 [Alternaria alternata]
MAGLRGLGWKLGRGRTGGSVTAVSTIMDSTTMRGSRTGYDAGQECEISTCCFPERKTNYFGGVADIHKKYTSLCFVETRMTEGASCPSPRCHVQAKRKAGRNASHCFPVATERGYLRVSSYEQLGTNG